MSTIAIDTDSWIGCTPVGSVQHKLGTIEEIYLDEESERPLWMVIRIWRFSARHTFVPLADARRCGDKVVTLRPDGDRAGAGHRRGRGGRRRRHARPLPPLRLAYGTERDAPRESVAERVPAWIV